MKPAKLLEGIYDGVVSAMAALGAAIVFFMMLSVSIGVVMRFFFHRSPVWLIEISGYGMVFMTFLVAAWVLREEGHVRIDLLLDRLNYKYRVMAEVAISAFGSLVCFIIAWYGVIVVLDHLRRGVRTPTDLEIPWAPLLAVIPLGCLALAIQFLIRGGRFLKQVRTAPRDLS